MKHPRTQAPSLREALATKQSDYLLGSSLDCFAALAMTECAGAIQSDGRIYHRCAASSVSRETGVLSSVLVRERHTSNPKPRHGGELLRRSNPDCLSGEILDCFAALAMTERAGAVPIRPSARLEPAWPSLVSRETAATPTRFLLCMGLFSRNRFWPKPPRFT